MKLPLSLLLLTVASATRFLEEGDYDFVTDYQMKFQGCHHVQQWNDQVDDENDVRIATKRLARFRLCPSDSTCSKSRGCDSKYGDYIVDLGTFLEAYMEGLNQQCEANCNCNNDDADCLDACYQDMPQCATRDYQNYVQCAQAEFTDENGNPYYIGAYCADQGGAVKLGVFSDDTCTTFDSYGLTAFYNTNGFSLPSSSLVGSDCMDCADSDVCANVYPMTGKCETRMKIDYPNESSCGYIEGIKIIKADGVIRTSTTRKSKSAAVTIGLFLTLSVLLAGYVYYLRTKLSRAQINLAAASQPLA